MIARPVTKQPLQDIRVNVKVKLASLWASLMLLYIYVDYFHLYMPDALESMIAGKIAAFDINQLFLLAALVSMAVPALMIYLSIALPAKLSRRTNLVVAAVYIPYTLSNLIGVAWVHMMFGAAAEVALLLLVVRCAWKWPRTET